MWTMGYNDGNDYNKQDSFNGRKLRPLIPRPFSSPNNTSNSSSPLNCLQGNEFFSLNQHMATISDQSKRELNTQPAVVVSSRWNPTPEQLRTLEELYQRGTRTPSADQIQHITAQLRRYGKIEGKNVFYWFQNHKARERQKRRRQMESDAQEQEQDVEILGRKESGSSRTVFEGEETKNWGSSTNCSTSTEKSVSIQRAAKAAVAEFRPDGWIQFDEEELQPTRSFMERNATWQQMVQLSSPPRTHLINSTNSIPPVPATPNIATPFAIKTISINPTTTPESTIRTMDPKPIKTCNLMNIFIASHNGNEESMMNEEYGCGEESQTLQLFPLRSSASNSESYSEKDVVNTEASSVGGATNPNLTSFQFYEFLPPKN